jgi:hypothetical protein
MMRLPLPAILAALVAVAAGSVLLNVYLKSDVFVINATALLPGQNMTITLDHIPAKIQLYGSPSERYEVTIRANATFIEVANKELQGVMYRGVYRTVVMGGQTIEIEAVDVSDTHAVITVYAFPQP